MRDPKKMVLEDIPNLIGTRSWVIIRPSSDSRPWTTESLTEHFRKAELFNRDLWYIVEGTTLWIWEIDRYYSEFEGERIVKAIKKHFYRYGPEGLKL